VRECTPNGHTPNGHTFVEEAGHTREDGRLQYSHVTREVAQVAGVESDSASFLNHGQLLHPLEDVGQRQVANVTLLHIPCKQTNVRKLEG
jgi:hypothetical protein